MTMIKKLPLTMAVIAAFFPLTSVMAQEFTQEQIDAIVAKAVDKALADRQAKIDAAANKKVDVITGNDSNLLVVFYVQIMSNDFVMQFSLQA
ncbi:maltoporin [Klebsiella pneumoniae]|nr:maltoporin [Klebsiella pneumoniae]